MKYYGIIIDEVFSCVSLKKIIYFRFLQTFFFTHIKYLKIKTLNYKSNINLVINYL